MGWVGPGTSACQLSQMANWSASALITGSWALENDCITTPMSALVGACTLSVLSSLRYAATKPELLTAPEVSFEPNSWTSVWLTECPGPCPTVTA